MSNQVARIDVSGTTNLLDKLIIRNKDNFPAEIKQGVELLKNNAMLYVSQDKTLSEYAMKNPMEVAQHLYYFVTLGLDVYRKDAYLLMYAGRLTPIIDYKGLIALVLKYSAVDILKIEFDIVKENDNVKKANGEFTHEYNPFEDRGKNIGAICVIYYANGSHTTTVMTREEIDKVRNASPSSKSAYSPWMKWEESMWIKTVIRKATKTVPLDFNKGNMETSKLLQESYDKVDQDIQFEVVDRANNEEVIVQETVESVVVDV